MLFFDELISFVKKNNGLKLLRLILKKGFLRKRNASDQLCVYLRAICAVVLLSLSMVMLDLYLLGCKLGCKY